LPKPAATGLGLIQRRPELTADARALVRGT